MSDARPEQNYRIEVSHPVLLGVVGHDAAQIDLSPDRPDYIADGGTEVWMERKRQKTRFLAKDGYQIGPVHHNLAPAVAWARLHGWRDPSLPQWFNDGAIAEARAGGAGVEPVVVAEIKSGSEGEAVKLVNADEIPDDLPPGSYCCHLDEGSTLWAMKVRVVIPPQVHDPKADCCLIQITKTAPDDAREG